MSILTLFLVILVVSLILGNGFLFLVGKKSRTSRIHEQVTRPAAIVQAVTGSEIPAPVTVMNVAPLEKKIELAHVRLQELEGMVKNGFNSNGRFSTDESIKRKIERLDSFRSTAESEIIGMKEILLELQKRHITVKARSFKNEHKGKDIPKDELRKIIYNSSN